MLGYLQKKILPYQKKFEKLELNNRKLFDFMEEGFAHCQIIYTKSGKPIDFRYLYVNPAFAHLTGLSVRKVTGNTSTKAIPGIESYWLETYARVVKTGKSEHFENTVASLGKQFTIKAWRSGPGCFSVLFDDISKIKRTNKALEHTNQELQNSRKAIMNIMEDLQKAKEAIELKNAKDEAMFASIGEGLIAVDNEGRVMAMNKVVEKILGWTAGSLIGKKLTSLPLENEVGQPIPFDKRPTTIALTMGNMTKATYFFVRKDKTRLPIAITATPIKLNGETIGLIEIVRDVAQEREIDRAKTEFVSLASHQLKTPLGISKWYIEAIQEEGFLNHASAVAKDYFNEIYKSNERLLTLVRDLLSISRIDQGKVKNTPQLVNITELVGVVIKNLDILARKNMIKLHLDVKNSIVPSIFIDRLRVQEVMENLITNAILYSNSSGKVAISVDATADAVLISVKDSGIGISSEDQKNLFTRFFRSGNGAARNIEGSGLGLYVVKSYVEGWGGTVSVKSTEGKGSLFSIILPFKNGQAEEVVASKERKK